MVCGLGSPSKQPSSREENTNFISMVDLRDGSLSLTPLILSSGGMPQKIKALNCDGSPSELKPLPNP